MPRAQPGSRENPLRTSDQVEIFPEILNEDPPEFTLVPLNQINYSNSHPLNISPAFVRSIRRNGVIIPIILDASNRVIDGRRRIEVTLSLGRDHIPAIRFLHSVGAQSAVITLTANVIRSRNVVVELEAIERLMRLTHATPNSIADRLGISRRMVHNRLRFRGLRAQLRRMVQSGRLSLSAALVLATRPSDDQRTIEVRLFDEPEFRPTAGGLRTLFGIAVESDSQIPLLPADVEQGVGFDIAVALVDRLIRAIPEPAQTDDPAHVEDLIFRLNHVAELIHAMTEVTR